MAKGKRRREGKNQVFGSITKSKTLSPGLLVLRGDTFLFKPACVNLLFFADIMLIWINELHSVSPRPPTSWADIGAKSNYFGLLFILNYLLVFPGSLVEDVIEYYSFN